MLKEIIILAVVLFASVSKLNLRNYQNFLSFKLFIILQVLADNGSVFGTRQTVSAACQKAFREQIIKAHSAVRAKQGLNPVKNYAHDAVDRSEFWVNNISDKDIWDHDVTGGMCENMAGAGAYELPSLKKCAGKS